MSSFVLKAFAMAFMLVDHLGILLLARGRVDSGQYVLMRTLGRFAFPVYAFLLAEGFRHLRTDPVRLRNHGILLLLLTVVSEPFFDLFLFGKAVSIEEQSVLFTLLIAYGGLCLAEGFRDRPVLRAGLLLLSTVTARLISSDYGLAGVLLVYASSWYLDRFEAQDYGRRLLGMLLVIGVYYLVYCWSHADFGGPAAIWGRVKAMGRYNIPHLLLVPILASYRGRLGPRSRILHRCYQWFYPAHLAILCGLAALLA